MRGKCFLYASGGLFLFIAKRKRKEKATKEGAFYKAAPSLETPLRLGRDEPFNQRLASDATREVVGFDSSNHSRALRAGAANAEHFPNLSFRVSEAHRGIRPLDVVSSHSEAQVLQALSAPQAPSDEGAPRSGGGEKMASLSFRLAFGQPPPSSEGGFGAVQHKKRPPEGSFLL